MTTVPYFQNRKKLILMLPAIDDMLKTAHFLNNAEQAY